MVAHSTVRTYGVIKVFQFVEGIWLHRKSRCIRFFFGKDVYYFIRAQHDLSLYNYDDQYEDLIFDLKEKWNFGITLILDFTKISFSLSAPSFVLKKLKLIKSKE